MDDQHHLDAYIEDALIGDDRPLAAEDRRLLRDVIDLARVFIRLDHQARAGLLDLARSMVPVSGGGRPLCDGHDGLRATPVIGDPKSGTFFVD